MFFNYIKTIRQCCIIGEDEYTRNEMSCLDLSKNGTCNFRVDYHVSIFCSNEYRRNQIYCSRGQYILEKKILLNFCYNS